MKTLKNIINLTLLMLIHQSVFSQVKSDQFCNSYIENQEIEFHSNFMENSFLQENKIDSNFINLIICTQGQSKNILHIQFLDSNVYFAEYKFVNNVFVVINNQSITYQTSKSISEIGGYYQYYFCNSRTDTYSKEFILYVKGTQKLRIMYERAVYSNAYLPETKILEEILGIINIYEKDSSIENCRNFKSDKN